VSKAVDENGAPHVVYHWSNKDKIEVFKSGFFGETKEFAEAYKNNGSNKEGRIYGAFLNIKNPFVMDANEDPYYRLEISEELRDFLSKKKTFSKIEHLRMRLLKRLKKQAMMA
jgi:hypothetical protein